MLYACRFSGEAGPARVSVPHAIGPQSEDGAAGQALRQTSGRAREEGKHRQQLRYAKYSNVSTSAMRKVTSILLTYLKELFCKIKFDNLS